MRIVIALGGNALLRRGEPAEADVQRRNVDVAARAIAQVARSHEIVVTHGNGPQVGLLALQSAAYAGARPYPLDVLGAESEGMVGYMLEQALENEIEQPVATLLTQTLVRLDDPAFIAPSKPIGPVYERDEAERLAAENGWAVARDGRRWRRVVPSPEPVQIVELSAVRLLLDAGVLVICAGGGGVPVVRDDAGRLHGVEAVVDKDLAASLLARRLSADMLVMLTDIEAVERHWGTPGAAQIPCATTDEMRAIDFAPGSMGPKVEAAIRFADATGGVAAIGSLEHAPALLAGRGGTTITSLKRNDPAHGGVVSRAELV
jgi:carbamate kinase